MTRPRAHVAYWIGPETTVGYQQTLTYCSAEASDGSHKRSRLWYLKTVTVGKAEHFGYGNLPCLGAATRPLEIGSEAGNEVAGEDCGLISHKFRVVRGV